MKDDEIRKMVREGYAEVVERGGWGGGSAASYCGTAPEPVEDFSSRIGYSEEEVTAVPEGANLGLGCGNPVALASLAEGETVLDLGSGGGFDCFLAAGRVGKSGRVIGVDMTPEMLDTARRNAAKGDYGNVEFRLGEIENLPVGDGEVDVIISNCVINLSPAKPRVFREAFRVLKPGGRLMVSDMVLLRPLPDFVMQSAAAYIGCVGGAVLKDDYLEAIRDAGFKEVEVIEGNSMPLDLLTSDESVRAVIADLEITREELERMNESILSVKMRAVK